VAVVVAVLLGEFMRAHPIVRGGCGTATIVAVRRGPRRSGISLVAP